MSAFTGESSKALAHRLSGLGKKTLVLSTSVERVIRQEAQLSFIDELLNQGGHMAIAFIWDRQTVIEPDEALALPLSRLQDPRVIEWRQVCARQQREQSDCAWPLVQPVIWGPLQPDSGVLPHINRAVQNAEAFVKGSVYGNFRGPRTDVPDILLNTDGSYGFEASREEAWRKWLERERGIQADRLSFRWLEGEAGHSCPCAGLEHCNECMCSCSRCKDKKRTCPCDRNSCSCPVLCNCSCPHCHQV